MEQEQKANLIRLEKALSSVRNEDLKRLCITFGRKTTGVKIQLVTTVIDVLLTSAQRAVSTSCSVQYSSRLEKFFGALHSFGVYDVAMQLQAWISDPESIGHITTESWRGHMIERDPRTRSVWPSAVRHLRTIATPRTAHLETIAATGGASSSNATSGRRSVLMRACTICKKAVESFYRKSTEAVCFSCRREVIDPFYKVTKELITPKQSTRSGGSYQEEFTLMASDIDNIKQGNTRLIVACFLLESKVQDGFQWPHRTHFFYNEKGVNLKQKWDPHNPSQCVPNLRERAALIPKWLSTIGQNSFRMATQGSSRIVLSAYLATEKTIPGLVHQIKSSQDSIAFDGKANIVSFFQRSAQDGIETMSVSLSLNCPLSVGRLKNPARGKKCVHIGCFDLETYILFSRNATSRAWCCPICHVFTPYHSLYVDAYIADILTKVADDDEMDQVEVFPTAEWKRKEPVKQQQAEAATTAETVDSKRKYSLDDDQDDELPTPKRVEIDLTLSSDEEEKAPHRGVSPPAEILDCDLPPPAFGMIQRSGSHNSIINLFDSDSE